jgi:hypothetical protein
VESREEIREPSKNKKRRNQKSEKIIETHFTSSSNTLKGSEETCYSSIDLSL